MTEENPRPTNEDGSSPSPALDPKPTRDELEAYFFQHDDDELDPDLLELHREQKRGSVLRPILMILIIVLVASVIGDWTDEVRYFFHPNEPIALGDVADFPVLRAEDPSWSPPIQHNTYVSVEGMPMRISRGGEYEFFRLIGGEFYVQRAITDEDYDPNRSLPTRQQLLGTSASGDRVRYQGSGRLVSFAAAPDRFRSLKNHHFERYGTRFCEDYSQRQIDELLRQREELLRANWALRYQSASPDEIQAQNLTPEPSPDEVDSLLHRNPVCVNAYLIQDGQSPRTFWRYLVFCGVLALLMIFNAVKLVLWFRDWFR